jgi:hypothetical protein
MNHEWMARARPVAARRQQAPRGGGRGGRGRGDGAAQGERRQRVVVVEGADGGGVDALRPGDSGKCECNARVFSS